MRIDIAGQPDPDGLTLVSFGTEPEPGWFSWRATAAELDDLDAALAARNPGRAALTPAQARYLSILAASDLRLAADEDGRTAANSAVIRDIHYPAWQALQTACAWADDTTPAAAPQTPAPAPPGEPT